MSVVQCIKCETIGLNYKNIIASFSTSDFINFSSDFESIEFDRDSTQFPDGQRKIVVLSCHADIQFCFDRYEYEEMKNMLAQSRLLIGAKGLI